MPLVRRELLRAAVIIPTSAIGAAIALRLADRLRVAAPHLRPRPDGTSATRCGACGGRNHTMLDPRCPAARRVL
jgi:hypothetical protein